MPTKKSTKKSVIQSVIFGRNWKTTDARKWLKDNGFKILAVDGKAKRVEKTANSLKYTIRDANDFNDLGFKKTKKGIMFMIGSLKAGETP